MSVGLEEAKLILEATSRKSKPYLTVQMAQVLASSWAEVCLEQPLLAVKVPEDLYSSQESHPQT